MNNTTENNNVAGGNGRGINTTTMIDCRLAGPADYIPAHIKQGTQKEIPAQANFTVFQNIRDKKMAFPVTAWGKMADVIARGGATGKQLHLVCSAHSYRGRVWYPTPEGVQPQFVLRNDGQPLLIEKIGFTVENISFGKDSEKTIQEEINAGFRPRGWNNPADPGYQIWREICRNNNSLQYTVGMVQFGYARVKQVNGVAIQAPAHQNVVWPQNAQVGQATHYQNTGTPMYVNNQYVGNAMPNQQMENQQIYGQQMPIQQMVNRQAYGQPHQFQQTTNNQFQGQQLPVKPQTMGWQQQTPAQPLQGVQYNPNQNACGNVVM